MPNSDQDRSLREATRSCRTAFVALVAEQCSDTLLPELLEVLRGNDDSGDREAASIRSCLTNQAERQLRLEEAEIAFVGFLDAFGGRTFAVPSTQKLTGVIRDAGVFHEVVVDGRSPRDVAARRGISAKRVADVVSCVAAIVEAVSGGGRRSGTGRARS